MSHYDDFNDLSTGKRRAGPYRLDAIIARGGFGAVLRATHLPTGEPAAVKVLHAQLSSDHTAIQRFEREADIVLSLAHPNVARIRELGRLNDGRPFIAMELLTGQSLDQRLQVTGKLSLDETLSILEPLADALDAAHARGIVHRDIKPSNVFLADHRSEGRVVLLDFGVAKLLDDAGVALTAAQATLGTIPFMAPEQMLGQPLDTRADVYALGALAFAMLTGKPPFGTRTTSIIRQIHLHARPPCPSELSPVDPALDEPILRALLRDPAQRPASAPELVRALVAARTKTNTSLGVSPNKVKTQLSIAVHIELCADPVALAVSDESLLEALESTLPLVFKHLADLGLIALNETSTKLLAISPTPCNRDLARQILESCIHAYKSALEGPLSRKPIELGIVVHSAPLHLSHAGALLPSGLLDVASWSPGPVRGVIATREALRDQTFPNTPLSGKSGYFVLEQ